jgi:hypothetical protein
MAIVISRVDIRAAGRSYLYHAVQDSLKEGLRTSKPELDGDEVGWTCSAFWTPVG